MNVCLRSLLMSPFAIGWCTPLLDTYVTGTNRVETEMSPRGYVTTYVWDGEQRIAVVNPLGYRTSYSYNGFNQVETVTDPLGNVTTNSRATARAATTCPPG